MKNHKQSTDLLSLPLKERIRKCNEIRAALKEKIAAAKIPVFWAFSEDVEIADPTQLGSDESLSFEREDLSQKKSILENLTKRLW